jgi:hypothetical protein
LYKSSIERETPDRIVVLSKVEYDNLIHLQETINQSIQNNDFDTLHSKASAFEENEFISPQEKNEIQKN